MHEQVTCLVTIHGVGFQQAPDAGIAGYADALHQRLSKQLDAAWLGDDPNRERVQRGQAGPIYVQSHWPPRSQKTEPGLQRLGTWQSRGSIDHSHAPLVDGSASIAHVALVYAHLEDQHSGIDASLEASAQALVSHAHYVSVAGLARLAFKDTLAALQHRVVAAVDDGSSLQVRLPTATGEGSPLPLLPETTSLASSAWSVIRALEDDISTYVCRNDLRTRLRAFVREALLRLLARDDVSGIVLNAHSQGTVLAFDVLRELPDDLATKVRAFVSSGSPLRKYVDLFNWGNDAGALYGMGAWTNFWDATDPTADPLAPPAIWPPDTDTAAPSPGRGLFETIDPVTGEGMPISVRDVRVDNLSNSLAGGLQSHNYWDNDREFVSQLAEILRSAAGASASVDELEVLPMAEVVVNGSTNGSSGHSVDEVADAPPELVAVLTRAEAADVLEVSPTGGAGAPDTSLVAAVEQDRLPLGLPLRTWASFRAPGSITSSR